MRKKVIKSKPSQSKNLGKLNINGIGNNDRCNHDPKFAGMNKMVCWFCGKPLEWDGDKLRIKLS
jgi:hypothetical protein